MFQCSPRAVGVSETTEEVVSSGFFQNNLWQLININHMLTLESLTDTSASSSIAFCS